MLLPGNLGDMKLDSGWDMYRLILCSLFSEEDMDNSTNTADLLGGLLK